MKASETLQFLWMCTDEWSCTFSYFRCSIDTIACCKILQLSLHSTIKKNIRADIILLGIFRNIRIIKENTICIIIVLYLKLNGKFYRGFPIEMALKTHILGAFLFFIDCRNHSFFAETLHNFI